jgi:hypothetical protein
VPEHRSEAVGQPAATARSKSGARSARGRRCDAARAAWDTTRRVRTLGAGSDGRGGAAGCVRSTTEGKTKASVRPWAARAGRRRRCSRGSGGGV